MEITKNCLQKIMDGQESQMPIVLQVLQIKETTNKASKKRYRCAISDGIHYLTSTFGSSVNSSIENGSIKQFSLIQVTNYQVSNQIEGHSPIFIILSAIGLQVCPQIGSPIKLENAHTQSSSTISPQSTTPTPIPQANVQRPEAHHDPNVIAIERLTSYLTQWSILAKIIKKGNVREYPKPNQTEPLRILNIILQDKEGSQIQGTFFGQLALDYSSTLLQDHVYKISGGRVKSANKKFNPTKHDFEITFDSTTVFEECSDASIGGISYHFISIDQISSSKSKTVDIIGRIFAVDEPQSFVSKKGRNMIKRRIELVDSSKAKIECTLWGTDAQNFEGSVGDVIAISNANVGEYSGVSLSVGMNSSVQLNPDIPEAKQIQDWWAQCGSSSTEFTSLTEYSDKQGDTEIYLSQINDRQIGTSTSKSDYFCIHGVITFIMGRRPFYLACTNPSCKNKSVSKSTDSSYFCTMCNSIIDHPEPRAQLSFTLSDFSGGVYCSIVGDDSMLSLVTGKTAKEWHDSLEPQQQNETIDFSSRFFHPIRIKVRARGDNYKGSITPKFSAQSITEESYSEAAKFFASEIRKFI